MARFESQQVGEIGLGEVQPAGAESRIGSAAQRHAAGGEVPVQKVPVVGEQRSVFQFARNELPLAEAGGVVERPADEPAEDAAAITVCRPESLTLQVVETAGKDTLLPGRQMKRLVGTVAEPAVFPPPLRIADAEGCGPECCDPGTAGRQVVGLRCRRTADQGGIGEVARASSEPVGGRIEECQNPVAAPAEHGEERRALLLGEEQFRNRCFVNHGRKGISSAVGIRWA